MGIRKSKKIRTPTLKEFAKRARCKDYMAAGFIYKLFKKRGITIDEFFGENAKNKK